jgi:hypothetical protein
MAKVIPIDGNKFRLPGPRDRMVNIGETGSGKSWAGIWHLANANFSTRPYVIIDPKNEEEIAQIHAQEIDLGYMPKTPGIYVTHPLPTEVEKKMLDNFFLDCWDRENIGLFLDEAMFCDDGPGLTACLTQGRSKRIPMIMNTQRPVDIPRLVFNQASFFQIFPMNDDREMRTVRNFAKVPQLHKGEPLPQFWSWYRDVQKRNNFALRPVPHVSKSIARINSRLDAIWEERRVQRF